MRRFVRYTVVRMASTFMLVMPVAAVAGAGTPTKVGQHFIGLVNGSHKDPGVYTACAGPVWPGRTGPVTGNQTMSVVHVKKGHGYTGRFNSIYAWFQPIKSGSMPTQLNFKAYSTPRAIPTSIQVPCGGTGTVVFSSCPYLAPCAAGWVTYRVRVTFEDIAD